jgi:hypothetical protein
MWWYIPVTLVVWRLRWEDWEFEANLWYIARPCLKQTKIQQKGKERQVCECKNEPC